MKAKFTVDDVLDHLEHHWQMAHSNPYFSGEQSRSDLAASIGCSYSTANRLVSRLLSEGKIKVRWEHQHQSYWEAWFSLV